MITARDPQQGTTELKTETSQQPNRTTGGIEPPADNGYQQNILVTAKGGGISFLGKVFEYVLRFVFSIIVTRNLGPEQYGLYTLGLTLAQIVSVMALLGLQTGMVRYLAPAIVKRDDARVRGIIQIGLGLPALLSIVLAVCTFLWAEPISILAFRDPRLVPLIRFVSICIPLDAISFIAYVIVISFKQPKYMTLVSNVITPLVKLLLTIGFLLLGWGTFGAVSAHVAASAVGLAAILFFVNTLFPFGQSLKPAVRNTGELLKYSLPVHMGWVFNTLRGSLETLILGFVGLTAGVGIYSVALRVSTLGNMLFLAIGYISTPIIADLHSRGEKAQLKSFYQTTTKWILMFNLPLFLTFLIFAKPILSIFGAEFSDGSQGLVILALGSLVYTGTGLGANILDMTDHTRLNSANSAFMVMITIVLDLLLIPRWGVLGAAAASAFSTVIVNLVCMIEVLVLLKMLPYERGFLKLLAAGAVSAATTYFAIQYLALPSLLLLFAGATILWGIYILVIVALGLSADDRMVIASIRYRLKMLAPKRNPVAG